MRTCNRCKTDKDDSSFYAKQAYCKACCVDVARKWYHNNKKKKSLINKAWRERNPERRKTMNNATAALWKAIREGKITRGIKCEHCDSSVRIEGAHFDYSKPLEVLWLCCKCHRQWDMKHPKTATNDNK